MFLSESQRLQYWLVRTERISFASQ